jgi:hypothetical protein
MRRTRPCLVCGKLTSKFLFNERKLDLAICSGKCEHQYIGTIDGSQGDALLRYLDDKIDTTTRDKKASWALAGAGMVLFVIGFFMANVLVFLVGAASATVASFSLRYLDDKREKLTKKRKRIAI